MAFCYPRIWIQAIFKIIIFFFWVLWFNLMAITINILMVLHLRKSDNTSLQFHIFNMGIIKPYENQSIKTKLSGHDSIEQICNYFSNVFIWKRAHWNSNYLYSNNGCFFKLKMHLNVQSTGRNWIKSLNAQIIIHILWPAKKCNSFKLQFSISSVLYYMATYIGK